MIKKQYECNKYKIALQKIDDLLHNSEQKYNCIDYETVIAIKRIIIDSLYNTTQTTNSMLQ